MDETRAAAILSALAQGVNPVTGEIFPSDGPYQHADVVRALHAAVDRFKSAGSPGESARPRMRAAAPSNVGKRWSEDDDRLLLAGFDLGRDPGELAHELGRTLAGIEARLEKHGRLSAEHRRTVNRYGRHDGNLASAVSRT